MLWFELKSSRVRSLRKKLGLDLSECAGVNAFMGDADEIDPDLADLVVQLCTRIGMIMEDVGPLAIDASRDGLEVRAANVVDAIRTMTPLANAVEALMAQ